MRNACTALTVIGVLAAAGAAAADGPSANQWVRLNEDQVGPRISPALVWSAPLKRFVLLGGAISHEFKGERPYDVQSLPPDGEQWFNDLPALPTDAPPRGGPTGNVRDPGFKSPYYAFGDDEGLAVPNRRHMVMWYQYALAPWDGCVYALICGRTLRYDPKLRTWTEMDPPTAPAAPGTSWKADLAWGALVADPVNREIVLFGGNQDTVRGGPGTWVYSTEKNDWRRLELEVQPPVRALSPMVFDPTTKKIVLFGGDRLDQLYADTWVYDCGSRTWQQRRPPLSPSPRFGHALLFLPRAGKVVLIGGKGYTSSTSYMAMLYRALPLETWTYDVAADRWTLIGRQEQDAPPQRSNAAAVAAVSDDDVVLMVGAASRRGGHDTWRCRLDVSTPDADGTAKFGVPPGTLEFRQNSYDPDWYTRDLPEPDPAAQAEFLAKLPANQWVAPDAPRWPANRMGGGWSTVALDTDGDRILHIGGGHSSYFGNDVAIYDIPTGRWSISYRPQFALEFNYDLSGPGLWAFNGAPWGNHNYHAYAYDPTGRRMVYVKDITRFYDPQTKTWPHEETIPEVPFHGSKYTTYLTGTPEGIYCWAIIQHRTAALFRLDWPGRKWVPLEVAEGSADMPVPVTDGSTITFDSKRRRLMLTTTTGGREPSAQGQVWVYDIASRQLKQADPAGADKLVVGRFAREAVYLPKADLVLFGHLLPRGDGRVVPLYDVAANRWLTAEIPGSEFMAGRGGAGSSVDLGLVYDPKRDLVWATLCNLGRKGALNVLRLDPGSLNAEPLK